MRSLRSRFTLFIMSGLLSFACIAAAPNRAYAEMVDIGQNPYLFLSTADPISLNGTYGTGANFNRFCAMYRAMTISTSVYTAPSFYMTPYYNLSSQANLPSPMKGAFAFISPFTIPAGTKIYTGSFSGRLRYEWANGSYQDEVIYSIELWTRNNNGAFARMTHDELGSSWVSTSPASWVVVTFKVQPPLNSGEFYVSYPYDFMCSVDVSTDVVGAITNQTTVVNQNIQQQTQQQTQQINQNIQQQTQQQTNTLMDTTGAEGVTGGAIADAEGLESRFGDTATLAQTFTSIANAWQNASAQQDLVFPEIRFMEYQIMPAQTVPLNGYLTGAEDSIRLFNTMLIFVVWLRSMIAMFEYFFGEEEEFSYGSYYYQMEHPEVDWTGYWDDSSENW